MSPITIKLTNILFISFFLMSAFSSIKIKNLKQLKKSDSETAMNFNNENSFVQRNSSLTDSVYSHVVRNLNKDYKDKDAKMFREISDLKNQETLDKAKFFKNINEKVRADNKKNIDVPRDVKQSEKELIKTHFFNNNGNSFVQKDSPLSKMVKVTKRIMNDGKKLNQDLNEEVIKPKRIAFNNDVKKATHMDDSTHIVKQNLLNAQKENSINRPLNETLHETTPFLERLVNASQRMINGISEDNEHYDNGFIKSRENRFNKEEQKVDQIDQRHKNHNNQTYQHLKEHFEK